jgi:LysM repeat protein
MSGPGAADTMPPAAGAPRSEPPVSPPLAESWPDSMSSQPTAGADPLSDTGYFDRGPDEQLGAFDPATSTPSPMERIPPSPQMADAQSGFEPDHAPAAPVVPFAAVTTPDVAPPATGAPSAPFAGDLQAEPDGAPVPAFLAGRPSRPKASPPIDRVTREDVVPSWEIDGRFGAQGPESPRRGGGAMTGMLTMIAVVVIIGLGIAAVILIPGLLNGPGGTPRPSLTPGSSLRPSVAVSPGSSLGGVVVTPTATASATATSGEPTAEPTPQASPEFYRIKPGDTLAKVARKHDITVEELLAANPQITNPDHVEVGQVVIIPPPSQTPAP